MSRFGILIECIRSGQLSEKQISEELKDPHFAAYYRQQTRSSFLDGVTLISFSKST